MRITLALAVVLAVGCSSKIKGVDDLGSGGDEDMGLTCGNGVIDPATEDCDDGADNGALGDSCNGNCHSGLPIDRRLRRRQDVQRRRDVRRPRLRQRHGRARRHELRQRRCSVRAASAWRRSAATASSPRPRSATTATRSTATAATAIARSAASRAIRRATARPRTPCAGQGTCNDTTHVCTPGTPLGDGTTCGTGNDYCKGGVLHDAELRQRHDGARRGLRRRRPQRHQGRRLHHDVPLRVRDSGDRLRRAARLREVAVHAAHVCQAVADTSQNGMSCGSNARRAKTARCRRARPCAATASSRGRGLRLRQRRTGRTRGCESGTCKFSCASATTASIATRATAPRRATR